MFLVHIASLPVLVQEAGMFAPFVMAGEWFRWLMGKKFVPSAVGVEAQKKVIYLV
jgi:hypothetical protein